MSAPGFTPDSRRSPGAVVPLTADQLAPGHRLVTKVAAALDRMGLPRRGGTVGVALSGGADSVALLAALRALGVECAALHCDFGLRGEESDRDAAYARMVSARLGARFVMTRFDVAARMAATGESVEMACRWLRYDWFGKTASLLGLPYVAIAHNADDNEETFLLNTLRGSGLKGLGGIPWRRGIYARPMLGSPRSEVLDYLAAIGVPYVTDSSNLADDYRRNRLRHHVLPAIRHAVPGASAGFARTMANLRADCHLLHTLLSREEARYIEGSSIKLDALLADYADDADAARPLLFHLMRRCCAAEGSIAVIDSVMASASESGRYFAFGGRRWLLDRGTLRLLPEEDRLEADRVEIAGLPDMCAGDTRIIPLPDGSAIEASMLAHDGFAPARDQRVMWVDADDFPSIIVARHPGRGDRMAPYGMGGTTLLSKLMKDARIPDDEKPRRWVLSAGDDILWLAGVRVSRLYPVTARSRRILRLTWRD